MIQNRIAQYIQKEGLLSPKDKVLLALSGGADSVALLRLLKLLGYECEAAHCNFQLRDEESERDEQFVRQLCAKLDVKLHVIHFDTNRYATEKRISIEMAARELRYQWFEELKEHIQASVIAIAHHKDDSVETLLLNLIRGTGINGLLGIRPRNGNVIRPLLCVNRNEILDYLCRIGQDYVTDSTNLQDEYTRNKIRLNLLPIMQEINPAVKESLLATSDHLNQAAVFYNKSITEGKKRVLRKEGICIEALQKEPSPSSLLFEILHPLGFNPAQIEDIYQSIDGQPGKKFIGKGWRVVKDRKMLLIDQQTENSINTVAPPFKLVMEEKEYTDDFNIPRSKEIACFDTAKFLPPLTIRRWRPGDVFIPFGMRGKKKVSDYLTDRKYSLPAKEQQWVLCSKDCIAWLIGERTDNRFKIDGTTKRITIIRIEPR